MKSKIVFLALILTVALSGCKKDKEASLFEFKSNAVNVSYGKTVTLELTTNDNATFISNNELVATVSDKGVVSGKLVGEVKIIATSADGENTAVCTVKVLPTVNMYIEPLNEYGKVKVNVKAFEKRSLYGEELTMLLYFGENFNVRYVGYEFDDSGKYSYSIAMIANTAEAEVLLKSFLDQRYIYLGVDGDFYVYQKDSKSAGVVFDDELGLCVIYLVEAPLKSGMKFIGVKAHFQQFKNQYLKTMK